MSNRVLSSSSLDKNKICFRLQQRCSLKEKTRCGIQKYSARIFITSRRRLSLREKHSLCASDADHNEAENDTTLVVHSWKEKPSGLKQAMNNVVDGTVHAISAPFPQKWKDRIYRWSAGDQRRLQRYYEKVAKINALEQTMMNLRDHELQNKTNEFRQRIQNHESLEDILVEAFAVVRETSRRLLNMRHYDCQLVGGMVLHEGQIAEMETGEGKTLVATLPVYLNVCGGHQAHIITVNEYLADRDAKWMGTIYSFLGLTVVAVKESMSIEEKQDAYKHNVVYVTAQKLCFDYLHDWGVSDLSDMVLQELDFAIVDEVDSILIDESRNPMVVSSISSNISDKVKISSQILHELVVVKQYGLINQLANRMTDIKVLEKRGISEHVPITEVLLVRQGINLLYEISSKTTFLPSELMPVQFQKELHYFGNVDVLKNPEIFTLCVRVLLVLYSWTMERLLYRVDHRKKNVTITEYGAILMKQELESRGVSFESDGDVALWECTDASDSWGPYLLNSIKAYEFYKLGQEYIIMNNRIVIVDESTGRTRQRSRWQDSIHQAVEAKEQYLQELRLEKEGVNNDTELIEILPDDEITASITFQVFFRYYRKLSGMSGTALSEATEFQETYKLSVFHVPTHYPCQRMDQKPIVFFEAEDKIKHLVARLVNCEGVRPVLIGTNSVEESEALMENLQHNWIGADGEIVWDGENHFKTGKLLMLNARPEFVKYESRIIAQAGLPGMVTIATRMAGRGTDILLGGNPKGLVENALYSSILFKCYPELAESHSLSRPEFDLSIEGSKKAPLSISGMVMSALARANVSEDSVMTSAEEVEILMERVMKFAQSLRSNVVERLRMKEPNVGLVELDFEKHIRLCIAEIWTENESEIEKETPFVQAMVRCAVYLWLWYEQKCQAYGRTVRAAGGLLVVGMSIAESKRIENQLRGRAGRQGDPGESLMLADVSDAMFMQWQFEAVRNVFKQSSSLDIDRLEGRWAEFIVDKTRSELENVFRTSRTKIADYDEIEEEFRQQCHFLRRIIIGGTTEERNQLLYTWIQDISDAVVSSIVDTRRHPREWKIWKTSEDDDESLEQVIDDLFNPRDRTFLYPLLDPRIQQLPSLREIADSNFQTEDEIEDFVKECCQFPIIRVIPFTPEMRKDLKEALESSGHPKLSPSVYFANERRPLNLEIRHALTLIKRLLEKRKENKDFSVKGRYGDQVVMLQEYIGELMIMLFEERKLEMVKAISKCDDLLKAHALNQLLSTQKRTMLHLLDAYWSDFLKFCTRLKATTFISSIKGSPLEEFSLEAHKEFASMLVQYRQTVVRHVIAPTIYISSNNEVEIWTDLMNSLSNEVEQKQLPSTTQPTKLDDIQILHSDTSSETPKPSNKM